MALADHVGRHDHPGGVDSARRLRELGCDWIQISPFGFQKDVTRPELSFHDFTATQSAYLDSLRALGFHFLLKPDVWSRQFWSGDVWRGDIRMSSEEDWEKWFQAYRDYILHYAQLAQEQRIEMFCIGLEYVAATAERPQDWRSLIGEVRGMYSGPITYAAHGSGVPLILERARRDRRESLPRSVRGASCFRGAAPSRLEAGDSPARIPLEEMEETDRAHGNRIQLHVQCRQ
jgi:hypothetical protein